MSDAYRTLAPEEAERALLRSRTLLRRRLLAMAWGLTSITLCGASVGGSAHCNALGRYASQGALLGLAVGLFFAGAYGLFVILEGE